MEHRVIHLIKIFSKKNSFELVIGEKEGVCYLKKGCVGDVKERISEKVKLLDSLRSGESKTSAWAEHERNARVCG